MNTNSLQSSGIQTLKNEVGCWPSCSSDACTGIGAYAPALFSTGPQGAVETAAGNCRLLEAIFPLILHSSHSLAYEQVIFLPLFNNSIIYRL